MDLNQVRPQTSGRPMPVRRKQTVGIDLGTTNTVVARNFEALPLDSGGYVMPSAVAFPPSGATLVGQPARRRRAMDPKNTILSAKRVIGARWHSSYTAQFREHYPYDMRESSGGGIEIQTRAGIVSPRTPPPKSLTITSRIACADRRRRSCRALQSFAS